MFHTFVSSQPDHLGRGRLGVAFFSVTTHVALITIAALTSGRAATLIAIPRSSPNERIIFVHAHDLEHRTSIVRRGALARAAMKAARLIVPDLTTLKFAVDASLAALPVVPDVDLDMKAHITDSHDFGDANSGELLGGSVMWALSHPGRNGAYTEDIVEKTAWPERDNPRPRYPPSLQREGVEGSFVVEFVVDSTGKVDGKTLNFPSNTHPAFLSAVKDALLHSRYFPAEIAGLRVRQLVHQQFTFVLVRR